MLAVLPNILPFFLSLYFIFTTISCTYLFLFLYSSTLSLSFSFCFCPLPSVTFGASRWSFSLSLPFLSSTIFLFEICSHTLNGADDDDACLAFSVCLSGSGSWIVCYGKDFGRNICFTRVGVDQQSLICFRLSSEVYSVIWNINLVHCLYDSTFKTVLPIGWLLKIVESPRPNHHHIHKFQGKI